MPDGYRLFVNDERTILVRIWDDGSAEVATRESEGDIWGPPVLVREESTQAAGR